MRFIIFLSAFMVAEAINPALIANYSQGTISMIGIIFFISVMIDLIEFVNNLFKER